METGEPSLLAPFSSSSRGEAERTYEGETFTGRDTIGNTFTFTLEEGGALVFLDYNGTPGGRDRWDVEDDKLELTVTTVPLGGGNYAQEVVYTAASDDLPFDLDLNGVDEAGREHHLTASLATP